MVLFLTDLERAFQSIATSSLPHLSRLVSLRLQGNRLTELPSQIFRLVSLQELDVSQNLLTEIPELIGMLAPTLRELFLQSNHLEYLPQQLGRLVRLRLLDLADNRLRCIPVEVQRLVVESCSPQRSRQDEEVLDLLDAAASQDIQSIESAIANGSNSPQSLGAAGHDEAGGHDDDDYVQIRQGMKCWARGNRFWQVGVPWSSSTSASSSVIESSSVGTSTTLFLHSAIPLDPPKAQHTPGKNSFESISRTELGVTGIGVRWVNPQAAPFSPNGSSHQHQHHPMDSPPRIQQQPGHLVDRVDYVKDSYTSCSWTLSLADICSQIAGERLHRNPHYYCHGAGCRTKHTRGKDAISCNSNGPGGSSNSIPGDVECSLTLMPQWAVENLGLQDMANHHDLAVEDIMGDDDHLAFSGNNWTTSLERGRGTMKLTLAEREMQSDHCSVCHKRLYFEGMRWKGVGVMDERIVPLEWVACSVQCRGRAEKVGRRHEPNTDSDADMHGNLSGMAADPEEETFFFRGFDQGFQAETTTSHYQQEQEQQQQQQQQQQPSQQLSQQQEYPRQMGIEDRLSLRYGLFQRRSRDEDTENRTHSL